MSAFRNWIFSFYFSISSPAKGNDSSLKRKDIFEVVLNYCLRRRLVSVLILYSNYLGRSLTVLAAASSLCLHAFHDLDNRKISWWFFSFPYEDSHLHSYPSSSFFPSFPRYCCVAELSFKKYWRLYETVLVGRSMIQFWNAWF